MSNYSWLVELSALHSHISSDVTTKYVLLQLIGGAISTALTHKLSCSNQICMITADLWSYQSRTHTLAQLYQPNMSDYSWLVELSAPHSHISSDVTTKYVWLQLIGGAISPATHISSVVATKYVWLQLIGGAISPAITHKLRCNNQICFITADWWSYQPRPHTLAQM